MTKDAEQGPPISKLVTDLGPLLLFFGSFKLLGIYWATGIFVVATVLAAACAHRRDGRIPPIMVFTLVVVVVFGGLTIWLQDDLFIKLKVTVLNALFGAILLVGIYSGRPFLKMLMGSALELTDRGWRLLTIRYACFFFLLAALNEVVWRNVTLDAWMNFKVFGLLGLTLVFSIAQVGLIKKHAIEEELEAEARPETEEP